MKDKEVKYVTFEVNGAVVIIRDADSKQYGGLLGRKAAQVVASLDNDRDVELSASMKTSERIEVTIYGWLERGDDIGDMLLGRDCFLQRPDSYDTSRPYHNPQCLSQLDEDDDHFSEESGSISARITTLDENEKSRLTELLDSATGPTQFRRVHISEALVTKLKEYVHKPTRMITGPN